MAKGPHWFFIHTPNNNVDIEYGLTNRIDDSFWVSNAFGNGFRVK